IPNPASIAPTSVSLDPDRNAATAAVTAEVETKGRVAIEASGAITSQIDPTAAELGAVHTQGTEGPRATTLDAHTSGTDGAVTDGNTRRRSQGETFDAAAQGKKDAIVAHLATQASRPPPAVLEQAG